MSADTQVATPIAHPSAIAQQTAAALAQILREGTPVATVRAFEHALRYWQWWYRLRFGAALPLPKAPVSPAAVLQFVADHIPRSDPDGRLITELPLEIDTAMVRAGVKARAGEILSFNTVKQRIALLGAMHRKLNLSNPVQDGRVADLLKAAKAAAYDQGRGPRPKQPLQESALETVLACCEDTPAGRRDRALLATIYYSGGRRRGEIRWLRIEDCDRKADGYILTFSRIKAKATGELWRAPLVNEAAAPLDAWIVTLKDAGIVSGPVFVDVRGVKRPRYGTTGLSGHAVARILDRRLRKAEVAGNFTPHSLRKGFATERLDRGESFAVVQAMTFHADPRTLTEHYYRPADILDNPAARPNR